MTRTNHFGYLSLLPALLVATATPAVAHVGVDIVHDFSHGFWHPLTGLDHVLAMVAVGVIAARIGGRALWLVPATFLSLMALGGVAGVTHVTVPFIEMGIAASVICLGSVIALQVTLPAGAAMALVGVFALFHGFAHGAEIPAGSSASTAAAGFLLATVLLHLVGIGLGLGLGRIATNAKNSAAQIGGTAMSMTGVGLLLGWL